MRKSPLTSTYVKLAKYAGVVFASFILIISSIVVIHPGVLGLLASTISSLSGASTTVFFIPYGNENLSIGGTTSVDITVNTKVPINALGATISFPRDTIEVLSISKEKSFFDLWTEDTTIDEDSGEIRFSGGTTRQGGIMGTGTVLTLMVRAKTSGSAQLLFKNLQVYPSNNTGKPVDTQTRAITYSIAEPKAVNASTSPSGPTMNAIPAPSPDLNGDGKINLIDLSILTFKIMLSAYDPRYDLNMNGSVGLDDLSILLSKM